MKTSAPETIAPEAIAISMGDPAGIGPETIAMLFRDYAEEMRGCVVFGDAAHIERAAKLVAPDSHLAIPTQAISLEPTPSSGPLAAAQPCVEWGVVSARAGQLAAHSIIEATQAVLRGEYAALVTAPIHKEALHAAGFDYPGHTELLQSLCAEHLGLQAQSLPVRMMLANPELRTVLHSIHVSLREALDRVEPKILWETLTITQYALRKILRRWPRIAVAGLNPHAGEGGKFGREEIEIIAPVVKRARQAGWHVEGPFAPDTIFMRARQEYLQHGAQASTGFDVVIAMHHDQGLIPVKYLGVEHGVNVTLGLPLVRTSPDHGTAFDIAGTGQASAASLLAAIRMARDLAGV